MIISHYQMISVISEQIDKIEGKRGGKKNVNKVKICDGNNNQCVIIL